MAASKLLRFVLLVSFLSVSLVFAGPPSPSLEKLLSTIAQGSDADAAALAIGIAGETQPQKQKALIEAAKGGLKSTVKALLDAGADPTFIPPLGMTALEFAVRQGDPEVVKILLDAGAEPMPLLGPHTTEKRSLLPAAVSQGNILVAELLLKSGADPNRQFRSGLNDLPLELALRRWDYRMVCLLLEYGARDDNLEKYKNVQQNLRQAGNRTDAAIAMAKAVTCSPSSRTAEQDSLPGRSSSAVVDAVSAGDLAEVKRLLSAGADPNGTSGIGRRALHVAIEQARAPIIEALLAAGADPKLPDGNGWSALVFALRRGSIEYGAKVLVAHDPSLLQPNDETLSAEMADALALGRFNSARLLIDHGVNANFVDKHGQTPLALAVHNEQLELANVLLDRGVTIQLGKVTSLGLAESLLRQCTEASLTLIARVAGTVAPAELLRAAATGRCIEGTARYAALVSDDIALRGAYGELFYQLAAANDVASLKTAIARGMKPGNLGYDGRSALVESIERDHFEVLSVLLEGGANPNVTDKLGATPLTKAAFDQNLKICRLLIQHSADVNMRDGNGWPPLVMFDGRKNLELVKLLLDSGAKLYEPVVSIPAYSWNGYALTNCQQLSSQFKRACVVFVAEQGVKESDCPQLSDAESRNSCLAAVAMQGGAPDACKRLTVESDRDECWMRYAADRGDVSLCANLSKRFLRQQCELWAPHSRRRP